MVVDLPRRILIVRLGAIGDVVNALVLANAIRRADPAVVVGWAVHPLSRPLVQGHPSVDRVHVWARGGGLPELRRISAELRAERYELAIDLQRLAKSAFLARASRAPRILGFDRARTKEASFLLTRERIRPADRSAHMVDQYLEFAHHLGLGDARVELSLPHDPASEQWADSWVREHGSPVLLNLGASKPRKLWPAERFGELALAVERAFGVPIAFTGSAQDTPFAARARERARSVEASAGGGWIDLTGQTSLLQLAALQRRCLAVVTCDTGPMHIAVACGARVVALFGPGEPRRTGPHGQLQNVVRRRPDGSPAGLERDRDLRTEDIRVEHVLERLRDWLAPTRGTSSGQVVDG
ncbi:MAG: glycosyltransferase family 9 protein [Planctomycetota bacterium]|nr:glycosyltransferase family 9 protein [Planctomycetota bacterium]